MSTSQSVTILLIEDSATAQLLVRSWLADGMDVPYHLETAETLEAGLQTISNVHVDVTVLDLNLSDSEGLDTFRAVHASAPRMPVVIMSGDRDEETAVAAVREGAQDYIVKDSFDKNPLIRPIRFAIERASRQRVESELRKSREQIYLARAVQQELFPKRDLEIPAFDVAGRCDPADSTGGDYYDFFPMIGGRWGIAIGDVSGHGLSAALFMIGVRAVLRALVSSYGNVGFVVSRTNRVLDDDLHYGRFVTLFFLSLDYETRSFRYAGAGHPGYLFDTDGNLKQMLEACAPPLGIDPETIYESSPEVMMKPGEILLLYTDGLNEVMNPADEMLGNQRVFDLIKSHHHESAERIIEVLYAEADRFAEGQAPFDDITAVVVKCAGLAD